MNFKLLSIAVLLLLSGCISKYNEDISYFEPNTSEPVSLLPEWTQYEFIESKDNFYFISDLTTQFHTPTFAYRKVRRQLYSYFESDIDYILSPLRAHLSKSKLKKIKKQFLEYLAQSTLLDIRTNKKVVWALVPSSNTETSKDLYRYFVLISLNKKKLRLNERKFISSEIIKSHYFYQSLIKKQLRYCYENIKHLDTLDVIKHPVLINSLDDVTLNENKLVVD